MFYKRIILGIFSVLLLGGQISAQYFGKNKVNYETFDFKVYQTPNFDIYHYLENDESLVEYANWSEHWYQVHRALFKDTIYQRNPILLYKNQADFQQTRSVSTSIGVATGGVTEGLKNRVILPFAPSNQQSFHVLGHELVHAFQYNMARTTPGLSIRDLGNAPLYMIEGMAEYLSIGTIDAHTAMWMRDAVLHDDIPTLKQMRNPKYFPYRYGHAFWAFITDLRGDEIIAPYLQATARNGLKFGTQQALGIDFDVLSEMWVSSMKETYSPYLGDKEEKLIGQELISKDKSGEINISPVISPDGRYVIYLSEKDLFSIDLYLFDIEKNEIVRKVASSRRDSHLDNLKYIESAGAWAPDSKRFAFTGFSNGRNILVVKNVENANTLDRIRMEGVPAFTNPTWSPDGNTIVVVGLVEGQVDLYAYDLQRETVTQLTDDRYSELLPHFSPQGDKIYFSTDALSAQRGRTNGEWDFNLAGYDLNSGETEHIDIFPTADNFNPVVDGEGNVFFLSNRDGFRNVYRYEPESGNVYQITDVLTGVSGITGYAPAISVSPENGNLVYTHFYKTRYNVHLAGPEDFLMEEVDPQNVDFSAAELPRPRQEIKSLVDALHRDFDEMRNLTEADFARVGFKPQFQLDYISSTGVGVGIGTNPLTGTTTGAAGGVSALFSDILGHHNLVASASINGEIYDFAGSVAYFNRKHQFQWGAALSHTPSRGFGGRRITLDTLSFDNDQQVEVIEDALILDRIFQDQVDLFGQLPFSKNLRIEGSASYARYSFRREARERIFQSVRVVSGGDTLIRRGPFVGRDRETLDAPEGFNLWSVGGALVGDNAAFGLTAPLDGHRFRFGGQKYFGEFRYTGATADYRVYRFFQPIGLAFRIMHQGRYGGNANQLFPYFLGYPWYVRGFNSNNIQDALGEDRTVLSEDNFFGSKILVSNFEVRVPFTGPEQLTLIKSNFLFTALNLFADGGIAWYDFGQFEGEVTATDEGGNPIPDDNIQNGRPPQEGQTLIYSEVKPIFSVGASVRVNLFGALIVEPYYAIPLVEDVKPNFGLNIVPGW